MRNAEVVARFGDVEKFVTQSAEYMCRLPLFGGQV